MGILTPPRCSGNTEDVSDACRLLTVYAAYGLVQSLFFSAGYFEARRLRFRSTRRTRSLNLQSLSPNTLKLKVTVPRKRRPKAPAEVMSLGDPNDDPRLSETSYR